VLPPHRVPSGAHARPLGTRAAACAQTALLECVSAVRGGVAETKSANAEKDATIAKLRAQLAGSTPAEGKGGEKDKDNGAQLPKRASIPFRIRCAFPCACAGTGRDGTGRDGTGTSALPNLRQRLRDGYAYRTSARRHVHAWGVAASAS
jgi:hypothetical protein